MTDPSGVLAAHNATDQPLASDELAKSKLGQFPIVIGGIVAVVNVPGLSAGQLKLTGPLLADIYAGKVKTWSDPLIWSGVTP